MTAPSARFLIVASLVVPALAAAPAGAAAQLPDDPRLHAPFLAWDRGEYPAALEGYLAALRGPGGEALVPAVARLTGEPYEVTEVTTDGADVAVGPEGRYAVYATEAEGAAWTRVFNLEDGSLVAELEGEDAVLGPDGMVVWARIERTPGLEGARAALEAAESRDAYVAARDELAWETARARRLRLRDLDLDGDAGRRIDFGDRAVEGAAWAPDGRLFVQAYDPADRRNTVLLEIDGEEVREHRPGLRVENLRVAAGGDLLLYDAAAPGGREGVGGFDLRTGRAGFVEGIDDLTVSADGRHIAWTRDAGEGTAFFHGPAELGTLTVATSAPLLTVPWQAARPALSPDGGWLAWQARPIHDWELFAARTDAAPGQASALQLSNEIQHDQFPTWVGTDRVLAAKGEGRHRRSFLYEPREGVDNVEKLFHNNSVRTIAPEYAWEASPDGRRVVIVAERDGDTVSPERGVYVVHLDRPVTRSALEARLEGALAAENDLRTRGERAFAPIAERVREVTEDVDVSRIQQYATVLASFGSKYITQPGNRMASEYIAELLRSWGYEPELQWFEPREGLPTANVIARLPGTSDPGLVYVVSSHYDSVERGPGADDNSSGTTALLEVARVLKDHPQEATIELAFFTGEEAGLLGSREYVRRAVEEGKRIVGALNNDMVGWANDHRLDNTIRYSNPGIRDLQHAAAMQFSDLITYDALYYKSTDAAAYYEAYGDIVGGIGSYPVLGSPHYHQFSDQLNTIDHRLVAEVARTTAATLAVLASSPARLAGLEVQPAGDGLALTWDAAPERDVAHYLVAWTDAAGEARTREVPADAVASGGSASGIRLESVRPGSTVRVKAVDRQGLEGWDWARVRVAGGSADQAGRPPLPRR